MTNCLKALIIGLTVVLGASSARAQNCSGQAASATICGNPNASTGLPSWATHTALLDRAFGTTSGTVLNRGASVWTETAQPVLGANGGTGGAIVLNGATSGSITIGARAAAGTATIFNPPVTNGTINQVLITDGSGNTSWATAGSGTVSSVGLSMPGIFTVTNSPVVGAGTLTATLNNQNANLVWAGPGTGAAAAPTFRSLVGADLPNPSSSTLGGVQSFAAVGSQWIRQISTSGVPTASQPAFTDISGTVAAAQLPNPSASTLGGVESLAPVASKWINTISTSGVPSATQPAFSDISGSIASSQLPSSGNNTIISNISGGSSNPQPNTLTAIIDAIIGSTQGQVLYRSNTVWTALNPGTGGQVLTTGGAGANPSWTSVGGTGTVTSIATNNGITGGTITSSGTIGLATISTGNVLANVSGISAAPSATTPTQVLDVIGSTQGSVLYRGASAWTALTPGTGGQFLQTTGAGSTPQWAGAVTSIDSATGAFTTSNGINTSSNVIQLTAARRTLPTKQVFTSGSGTYTTPANTLWIEVTMVGGGAGGGAGNGGAGGLGGDTCWNTSGAACTTPVSKAGGAPATAVASTSANGGAGGAVSGTCDWSAPGGSGDSASIAISSVQAAKGGMGGSSSLGGGGSGGLNTSAGTAGATNTGGGGGGGGNTSAATAGGGPGGGSGATCHFIINTPAATYTYAVGAAGTGNTSPGTGGQNGGNGAAGQIIVYEHYGT
jgi:hypothetical protein